VINVREEFMGSVLWSVELACEAPAGASYIPGLKDLRQRAARQGIRFKVTDPVHEASFKVFAENLDEAVRRARIRWSTFVADSRLADWYLVHLMVDRAGSGPDGRTAAARHKPGPRTRPPACVAQIPERIPHWTVFDVHDDELISQTLRRPPAATSDG
jgi:hypothetical protein